MASPQQSRYADFFVARNQSSDAGGGTERSISPLNASVLVLLPSLNAPAATLTVIGVSPSSLSMSIAQRVPYSWLARDSVGLAPARYAHVVRP